VLFRSAGKPPDTESFYSYTSFTTPTTIYRIDLTTGVSTVFRRPKVAFDPDRYETSQIFYTSADGTRVPMFISHRKGLKRDGQNPTILYGYGGFNVSITPEFSVASLVWMEMGGIYAVANLRGGGEYGEAWHEAGTKAKKQNVFNDFISGAEFLIGNRYTSPAKLAISGGSNGGLLVGACLLQRPELFGAALPAVGVMDMLRFHKFTIGWAWVSDFGSSDDSAEFRFLHAYSPLHIIKFGGKYPATMVTTADHDDRVVPSHSFKFAATLQAAQAGPAPILIRIDVKAGHGAGKPTSKRIDEAADRFAFLVRELGISMPK
jgi:prolyl oligopeptidase